MDEKTVAFAIRIPRELHEQLKAKAEADERSLAQSVRFAIREYVQPRVESEKPPKPRRVVCGHPINRRLGNACGVCGQEVKK